ncbi:MAG: winged helix-turn-helix transcriptional regulator [Candidatus Heimdallarchaeota archaeon]
MSLERKKEPKETRKEEILQESKFRRLDFTPLKEEEKREIPPQIDELTEIERDVLKIAKNILKLKRYDADFDLEIETEAELQKYPIIEKLYAKCIAKLAYKKGYSKEDIFLAIRSLEDKTWIVTNERRTKLEILNNEKLVSILNFIESNPGIHARDEKVEKELDITRTPFLKHIMTLERFKLIRSKKIGKSLHYFVVDIPEDFDELKVIFTNPLITDILEEIVKDETVSISRIGEILDVYSGTIQYHIRKMKELDLVKSSKDQKNQTIHIVNIELLKKYNNIFKEPDFSKLLDGL